MDKAKVRVLEDIAKLNEQGFKWILAKAGEALETECGKKIRSSYRVAMHCHVLHWFGLLDFKGKRTGLFKINALGVKFLCGVAAVSSKIYCRDGKVVNRSEQEVLISDVKGIIRDEEFWDNYWKTQTYVIFE